MIDQGILDRAETLAEMAPDDSVTPEILSGREGRFSTATPLAQPPVTHLQETEAPAYVLTNRKRGIGLGSKRNTNSPTGERRTVVLVTGRRTLCLIGGDEEDETIEIPHESVATADYHTGLSGHRIALGTPRQLYHVWVHRKTAEELLAATTTFVEDRQPDEPEPIDGNDANRVMYRGRPVSLDSAGSDTEGGSDQSVTDHG